MKGDPPAACLRLCAALPVRTHERTYIRHVQGSKSPPPIVINHRRYESIMDAARTLNKNRSVIRLMLKRGTARYAHE